MSDTTPAPVDDTVPYDDPASVMQDDERDESSFALFEGDEGRLDEHQRRALVALLRHSYVSSRTHPDEWRAVLDAEYQLRSRLNDLFLELHVDRDREVAWKRQARSESQRRTFPTLLRDLPYTREETIVLVYLRMRLRADARPGPDQVVVDRSEILGHVAGFRPATATDRTRDEGRVAKAIERLVTARILIRTSDPDRFRVASVVEVLLPLERLLELDTWLRTTTAQGEATTSGGEPTDGDDPGLPADGEAETDTDDEGETEA
ncbi:MULTISPECIES: DUF4194 domain-containing protein [Curtobacterium]|uniref:DUF4194 domain-containing protein n=1 Tax=Curtobacterium TaxID=2034 RepID=UPI00217E0051|nr:DUF4194 domain-containing protein [Curtobacterium flaccumfaciens]MCS6582503.1 DUF4194 domain-containing protein [Curtobacterium flaccumfaciens pv. beticola]MCS6589920.1 DUF4194 domain-containing protein [Curtobacterium flaccumfaciens pv. flaccumfaciens]